jgi:tetratricopeptide (TPR) repeat protein
MLFSVRNRVSVFLIVLCIVGTYINADAQFFKKKDNGISKEQEQKAEEYFTEGVKEYALENFPKALAAFERSLDLNGSNGGTYYMIAQIYNKQGNMFKAIQFAQRAVSLDETNKYYYLVLAQTFEKKQDFNEAAKVYQNMLKKIPKAIEYNEDLANVLIILNKLEEAIKCYDRLEKVLGVNEAIIRQKQQLYLKLNKIDEAISQGKRLIEAYPDEQAHIIGLIEILINYDRVNEAEKLANDLLAKDSSNPYAILVLSDIYRSKNDERKANEYLERAFRSDELNINNKIGILIDKINKVVQTQGQPQSDELKLQCLTLGEIMSKVHPNDPKALAIYADILALTGNSRSALEYYLQAIKLDNSHFKIWQQIALLDHELNFIDSLKVHSEKALELFPNQTIFWFYSGLASQIKHDYKKSSIAFEEGKKLAGNDRKMLLQYNTMLGDSYNGTKEYKKSDEAFEEALKQDGNNFIVLNNYSYYLSLRKDKLDYARKLSEKVVKDNPNNATYLDTYAWILYVMKDYSKAKEIFEKIVDKSGNGTIVEHYGDVLYQLGEKDKALEIWKKAKQLGEASELIDKKIADKKLYE